MSVYRNKPDYSTRPTIGKRLGQVFLTLTLLLGLASAAFLLFFRGYVMETDSGLAFQAPFLSPQTYNATTASGSATISIPEPVESPNPLQAVLLPIDCVDDGSAAAQLRRAGGNAVVLTMKDETGKLSYVSDLSLAISIGASFADPTRNEALRQLTSECYTIAQVSCLQDPLLAAAKPELAMQRLSGSAWRDDMRRPWLSPWQGEVQTYLLGLCRELAALGFDEILLTDCAFPVDGRQDLLREAQDQDPLLRQTALESLYAVLSQSLQETGVTLSIQWVPSEATATAESARVAVNGQSLDTTLLYAARIWVQGDEDAMEEAFAAQGFSAATLPVIPVTGKKGDAQLAWAKF